MVENIIIATYSYIIVTATQWTDWIIKQKHYYSLSVLMSKCLITFIIIIWQEIVVTVDFSTVALTISNTKLT